MDQRTLVIYIIMIYIDPLYMAKNDREQVLVIPYPYFGYGLVVANGQKTTLRKINPDSNWLCTTMSYNER